MDGELATSLDWRWVVAVVVAALAACWMWKHHDREEPAVIMQANTSAPSITLPGVPSELIVNMARATDTNIPVVMTSGSPIQHSEDEIKTVVQRVLDRLDKDMVLIQVAGATKTVDSYKTVAYEIVASVFDTRASVSMLITTSVLVPLDGQMYVRALKPYHNSTGSDVGPPGVSDMRDLVAPAEFEDPVSQLGKIRLPS